MTEFNLHQHQVLTLLSEFKGLLWLANQRKRDGLKGAFEARHPLDLDLRESVKIGKREYDSKRAVKHKKVNEDDFNLICGQVNRLKSVFRKDGESEESEEEGVFKRKDDEIEERFLLPLDLFLQHCNQAKMVSREIFTPILSAFGISYKGKDPSINQYQYVAINAFIRYNTLTEEQKATTWRKMEQCQGG